MTVLGLLAVASAAGANKFPTHPLVPGSVVVSESSYPAQGNPAIQVGQPLANGMNAVADGRYPEVFNNESQDPSFSVATPMTLVDVDGSGNQLLQIKVPTDQVNTSFASKSEGALNFSTDGQDLSFLAYNAPLNALDISNSDTPLVPDPTNPVTKAGGAPYNRVAADLASDGSWSFTDSNSYSGDNGRSVLLNNDLGIFYAAGNSNNGDSTTPNDITNSGGAQVFAQSLKSQADQGSGAPIKPLGSFTYNVNDKFGKDTNFRGLTVYNNVVYMTKGSGSNGSNSIYFVDTSRTACPTATGTPKAFVGVPAANATLPTAAGAPYPMCILKGFNQLSAKGNSAPNIFPFGLWFANATTLYVADEGKADLTYDADTGTYSKVAGQTGAGLQKWTFDGTKWNLDYTLQDGLNLGQTYTVPGYPKGTNTVGDTTLPWAPATAGLRNITGHLSSDGSTATIYAATSTVSGSGDVGADPNQIVAITDNVAATTKPDGETFTTIEAPQNRTVYRGVAVVPDNYGS